MYSSQPSLRLAVLIGAETVIQLGALLAAASLRSSMTPFTLVVNSDFVRSALATMLLAQACIFYCAPYDDRSMHAAERLIRLGQTFVVSLVLLLAVCFAFPALTLGVDVILVYLFLALVGTILWRTGRQWAAGREAFREEVLIVGTGICAQQIAAAMLRRSPVGYHIVGFLGERAAEVGRRLVNPSVIGTTAELASLVRSMRINRVVVALDDRRGRMPVSDLLACRMAGVAIEESSSFFERLTGTIPVDNLHPSAIVFARGFGSTRNLAGLARWIELAAATVALLLASPVLALLAILIRLDSPGPALFKQERVGENGKTFGVLKLRTMQQDAESASGPVWKPPTGDDRTTRVGRLLRKSRLDELPQLINVLKGEMSFVGPRPERPHFVEKLRALIPYYDLRHAVKPGITGWAQINYSYASTIEDAREKLQYDLYYVKHRSVVLDLSIMLETAKVLLIGKGAR